MVKKYKLIVVFIISMILIVFSGCTNNKFEVVAPPINLFPTPVAYNEEEVDVGNFSVEKYFSGNKVGNKLVFTSDTQTTKGFVVGEKGKVTYFFENKYFEYDAVLISCPTGTQAGEFIAESENTNVNIRDNYPGKFSVITYFKENAILVPKKAVLVVDENNNAIVLQVDENDVLVEKNIIVGNVNETHYEVIDGLKAGDKVVVR